MLAGSVLSSSANLPRFLRLEDWRKVLDIQKCFVGGDQNMEVLYEFELLDYLTGLCFPKEGNNPKTRCPSFKLTNPIRDC